MLLAQISYWMMVLTFTMMVNGRPEQVGQVTIKNFANQPDCLAHIATVTHTLIDPLAHSVSIVCQAQP
jgi:hypothetical protein